MELPPSGIDLLPSEILLQVFSFVGKGLLAPLRFVCQQWRVIIPLRDVRAFCTFTAESGDLKLLCWARAQCAPWDTMTCAAAAKGGHLLLLQYLRANGCPWDHASCIEAAKGGHLSVLQWAKSSEAPWLEDDVIAGALEAGRLNVLDWLSKICATMFNEAHGCMAARHCQQTALQWLQAKGVLFTERTCMAAVLGGHLTIVQWLRSQDCPWDAKSCMAAAHCGSLEVLQWLRSNGCPWDHRAASEAAHEGHLTLLQWICANDAPVNNDICADAADGGYLPVLRWLHAQGHPWDKTIRAAVETGHFDVLRWAYANGAPLVDGQECMRIAKTRNDAQILAWLQDKVPPE